MKKMIFLISLSIASMATYAQTEINSIGELRQQQLGEEFILTSEALVTYTQTFRNQHFIEDTSAGILLDDPAETITTDYQIGDAISGVRGVLTEFNGMLQFSPLEDPGPAISSNNELSVQVLTLAELSSDPESYESELVQLEGITIDNSQPNWIVSTEYGMTDDSGSFNFRTSFAEVNYLGDPVPEDEVAIVGIITERSDGHFFTSRDSEDLEVLSIADYEEIQVSAYPNPVVDVLNIDIRDQYQDLEFALIEGTTGKILSRKLLSNQSVNKINMTKYSSGLYFFAIYDKTNREVLALKKLIKR